MAGGGVQLGTIETKVPGRFAGALREAVDTGRARRLSRTRFGPSEG